ncbi:DNA-directed RNA polymerase III subunit RPC6 [Morus notabilis]|uniref:DNA-directed RNA polymerase III subunit RPC6 n=1 Tax=Morus notabilis TaxID=981085 RepID=W9RC58_9ROSA|nr:DNA-directed RNA polymerase III subunit RPC6 [Morus notabilis]EXB67305.1 DNA-directed RNA polymerase III subunit RPC6 [Morus notabilis]
MSRLQEPSSLKRKQPDSRSPLDSLTEHERIIYNVIRSKQDMGIWMQDMKRVAKVPDNVANKALKSLETKKLIKEVVNIQKRGKKHYVAAEFEPATEITGGAWYSNGKMDFVVINILKDQCLKWIYKQRVATLEGILDAIRKSGISNVELTTVQIEELVRALVLDNEVVEVKSNGMGEFDSIPVGKVCYKSTSKGSRGDPKIGAMSSIPCGVCPRISDCTPDGIISPKTCKYYSQWLDF